MMLVMIQITNHKEKVDLVSISSTLEGEEVWNIFYGKI